MKREELISSREYWISKIQLDMYNMLEDYIKANDLSRSDLAKELNVSKGYISQVLNAGFDHKISKMVDLALAVNKVPIIQFKDKEEFLGDEICYMDYYSNIKGVSVNVVNKTIPLIRQGSYYQPTSKRYKDI